jgi:Asp-tRNA(Asn)/Glu-tRNA(Gln) amidotransferase A subunit family amidase
VRGRRTLTPAYDPAMAGNELWRRDAWDLADCVRAGVLGAQQLLELSLARIEYLDPKLNAVWFVDADRARADAEEIDLRVKAGEDPGRFAGIPMGVKELAQVRGWPDTCGSVAHADAIAEFDCSEVARLRAAGAVLVGLTTAPEHGDVSYTASRLHGVTRNPWNLERTPGGSSGGSAAAVAAGLFPACTGSDGGGSIRIPSSYTGLFGMKSTFGLLAAGPEPFNYSMTSVHGPIVRSVRDAARYLDVTSGPSLTDPTSLPKPPVPFEDLVISGDATESLRGKRAAWSSTLGYAGTDPEVEKIVHDAAMTLVEEAGLELVDIPVEMPKPGAAWGLLSAVNTAAFHLEFECQHVDELEEVHQAAVEMTMNLRPSGLYKAIRRRHELMVASARIFSEIDVLLTPTTPTTAFRAEGTLTGTVAGRDVNLMRLSAPFTAPFNMTCQPAASIPVGLADGLPVAVQVVAPRHGDALCLGAGALMEQLRPWPKFAALAYE